MNNTTTDKLAEAVTSLSGACDGAFSQDGSGFNKLDTQFGHQMAAIPAKFWTVKQRLALYKMIGKYRGQLQRYGISFDSIPTPREGDGLCYVPKRLQPPLTLAQYPPNADVIAMRECADTVSMPSTKQVMPPLMPTTGKLIKTNGGAMFIISFPYSETVKDDLKANVKGVKWDKDNKQWVAAATLIVAESLKTWGEKWAFTWEPEAEKTIQRLITEAQQLFEASTKEAGTLHLEGFGVTPYPFQRAGIEYALKAKRTFIADEMGLGKTIQALGVIHTAHATPALVVCPASLKYNWQRESEKCLPNIKVFVVENRNDGDWSHVCNAPAQFNMFRAGITDTVCKQCAFEEAEIYIINYDILSAGWEQGNKKRVKLTPVMERIVARELECLVLDESHACKSTDAQRTCAARQIAKDGSIEYRLLLSGTPILNRPDELPSQLEIIDRLSDFGGWWKFMQRYCGANQKYIGRGKTVWDFKGASNLQELNQLLRTSCFVRREKKNVLKELPDKQRTVIPIEITNRKDYERAERELIRWIHDKAKDDTKFLATIQHLSEEEQEMAKRAHAVDKAEKARRAEELVRINELKQVAAKGQMAAVKEWVEEFLETGKKLVLFAYYKETQAELMKLFPDAAHVFGDDSAQERQQQVDRFQTDPDCPLIICSLSAGGVGITLTAASDVLTVELGWTPGLHDQAEDRCHRIGQKDSVNAWYLIGRRTIFEDTYELIQAKRSVVDRVVQGSGTNQEEGILKEVINRLVNRVQSQ